MDVEVDPKDYDLIRTDTGLRLNQAEPDPASYGFGSLETAMEEKEFLLDVARTNEAAAKEAGQKRVAVVRTLLLIGIVGLALVLSVRDGSMPPWAVLLPIGAVVGGLGLFALGDPGRDLRDRAVAARSSETVQQASELERAIERHRSREQRRLQDYSAAVTRHAMQVERQRRAAEERELRLRKQHWLSLRGESLEIEAGALFRALNFTVTVTRLSGDHGVDLYLRGDNVSAIVQCKGFASPAGPETVRDLYGTMLHQRADCGVLICPVGWTRGVAEFAREKPILLLDADSLVLVQREGSLNLPVRAPD